MAAFLLLVATTSAQNVRNTNKGSHLDVPAIAEEANGRVVSIVMSDENGHPIAQGSGFLISKDGEVVTNYHVIKNGSSAVIKFPSGAFFVVEGVLASDKDRDVAIIQVHGNDFRMLTLGDSERLHVGEEVVAIGSPLSLESTVSNGIISGIRTVDEGGGKFLQITAPIAPGSSGGPLFNMAGRVVGITTSHLKNGENLNFAVPINDVKPMLVARFPMAQPFPDEAEPVTAPASVLATTPPATPRARPAAMAQSNRTVLLMGADSDTIVTSFATENACADLHETRIFEKSGAPFDWALAVVGHEGRFEVALLDEVNKRATFLGTNYREGTRNACYIIRGLTNAKWEPIVPR